MTRILAINPDHPQPRRVQEVVAVLEAGGVVAYPTDTTYGIGCDILAPKAADRIRRLKGKPTKDLLSFLCSDLTHLADYAVVSNTGFRLMKRLLPGPYTFVLQATKKPPRYLHTKRRTVGIRVPDHPIPLALVAALGRPIVNTTANVPGGGPLLHPEDIAETLGHGIDLIVDGGWAHSEMSTVVEVKDSEVVVLRPGKGVEAVI